MKKISAVITSFNNETTIEKCLKSVKFANEIVLLDSFSSDSTLEIAKKYQCKIYQQQFAGFSKQKQKAINLASNDWVLLLDSDEFLNPNSSNLLFDCLKDKSNFDAYELPRVEWVFWKWSHPWVHKNKFLRLFDKSKAKVSDEMVHESIKTKGSIGHLKTEIMHFGETSIHKKLEKINKYSQLSAEQKYQLGKRIHPIKLILYPPIYFIKQYIIRRQILNGWAGFINASMNSYYAFLKYSKLYELQKNKN